MSLSWPWSFVGQVLIFFMLATNFVQTSSVAISLPQTAQLGQLAEGDILTLLVAADGDIFQSIGKDTVAVLSDELGEVVDEYLNKLEGGSVASSRPSLDIKVDDKTMHGRIVGLMDTGMEKRIEDISIATVNKAQ